MVFFFWFWFWNLLLALWSCRSYHEGPGIKVTKQKKNLNMNSIKQISIDIATEQSLRLNNSLWVILGIFNKFCIVRQVKIRQIRTFFSHPTHHISYATDFCKTCRKNLTVKDYSGIKRLDVERFTWKLKLYIWENKLVRVLRHLRRLKCLRH